MVVAKSTSCKTVSKQGKNGEEKLPKAIRKLNKIQAEGESQHCDHLELESELKRKLELYVWVLRWLSVLDPYIYVSRTQLRAEQGQAFFYWYFIADSLGGLYLGGCMCFGHSCMQWKWNRVGYFSGRAHGFGDPTPIPAAALCHLREGMCRSVGTLHLRILSPLWTILTYSGPGAEISLIKQPISVKLFWQMQWSGWKGTFCEGVSWTMNFWKWKLD